MDNNSGSMGASSADELTGEVINYQSLTLGEKETWNRQEGFLAAYSECGSIRKAAPAAEVPRVTVMWWNRTDYLGFKARFEVAQHQFREMLQDMAVARVQAQKPNDNPVLLIALLNAHWPDKYRPNQQESDDTAKEVLAKLSEMQRARRRAYESERGGQAAAEPLQQVDEVLRRRQR